jgi:hypothetical protein
MVLLNSQKLQSMNEDPDLNKIFAEKKLFHPVLDFYLPHEFGGLGDCLDPKYTYINTFPDTKDLPIIRPKTTTNNKNEFNGKL